MKTILEHLNELPEPYRIQALVRSKGSKELSTKSRSAWEAIANAFEWSETPEGADYWNDLYTSLLHNRQPHQPPTTEAKTMTLSKYSNEPVATATLVYGTDVSSLTPETIISVIKANNEKTKAFLEADIDSPYIEKQIDMLRAANTALVTELDKRA